MLIKDLIDAIESIAPPRYAEEWDNVGLIVGDPGRELRGPVLLTIDLTEAVVGEARDLGAAAVISYHPPLFSPQRRITSATPTGRVLLAAIEAGLAIYSPHTALDAAPGGMTDWLADGLMDRTGVVKADRRALRPHISRRETEQVKIVTFVPEVSLDQVRSALATAGAGTIGEYEVCSFGIQGVGTFLAGAKAAPAVGEVGRLERVPEVRLEMVCSRRALPIAIETLRQFHPYEEPAIDIYDLLGRPERGAGAGRRLVLDRPTTVEKLAERVKSYLKVPGVYVAKASDKPVNTVGVCPGSGAELATVARAENCEVFVTGEMKHHDILAAVEAGLSIITAGHTSTERGYLPSLAARLAERLEGVRFEVSSVDKSPLALM